MKEQTPIKPSNWLYRDTQDGIRMFTRLVLHCDGDALWPECTDAEKTAWERAHQPQEPEREAAPNQIEDVELLQ